MLIEMELNKIIIDEKRHDQIIVLKEKKGSRILPIVIGLLEASSIKMKISGIKPPRPLTHDLLKDTIDNLGAKIERVIVDKLEHNTFHAKLYLKNEQKDNVVIDARPSDSIALAVRAGAPIFVEDSVIKKSEVSKYKK